jgi:DNA excision repair protein ERCC-2
MKTINISVQEFAQPSPRRGSIESSAGLSDAMERGSEIHQAIQRKRAEEFPNYKSEQRLVHEIEFEGYTFKVSGRMDGFFEGDQVLIEEIKSSFNIFDLVKKLKSQGMNHPYNLQLMTYGYLVYCQSEKRPELSFHLVSSRNHETLDYSIDFNFKSYEKWMQNRLTELVAEVEDFEKKKKRRLKASNQMQFPFSKPRKGQTELISKIEESFQQKKHLMVQAPTGLGKTVGVLYPSLKDSLSRGLATVYLTPKNSQHGVAEEAVSHFQSQGCQVKSLTMTSKSKLCMKAEPLCNPEYCEFARDYYDKIHEHNLKDELRKKKKLSAKVMKNLAEKYQVCPFELQLEAMDDYDVVICDYNYVFGERSVLHRMAKPYLALEGKCNLVIDEAHNIPSRTTSYYSPSLSGEALELMREDVERLPKKFSADGLILLQECLDIVKSVSPKDGKGQIISPHGELFAAQSENLQAFLTRYLDSDVEIKARDVVLRLVFYWKEFTEILMDLTINPSTEFFTSFIPGKKYGTIKITCCDASAMIRPMYQGFENVVAFSATLKPFEYYSKLSGLESPKLEKIEFQTPFSAAHRKILVIPQISTKFSTREQNYIKVAETVERITQEKSGNYVVFFPSFDFLERTFQLLKSDSRILKQKRFMKNEEVEGYLEILREAAYPSILLAVQGGVFSEGVDYPGNMLIGAFIVGPPLPTFDFEREKIREYYQDRFSQGFDYTYVYPAMAKAIQSAGRVIRTETDRGIIILLDDRFLQESYSKTFPLDWFTDSSRELVSQSILKDVKSFWASQEAKDS